MASDWKYRDFLVNSSEVPLSPATTAIQRSKFSAEAILSMNFFDPPKGTFIYLLDWGDYNKGSCKSDSKDLCSHVEQYDLITRARVSEFSENQVGLLIHTSSANGHLLNRLSQHPIIIDTPLEFDGEIANIRLIGPRSSLDDIYCMLRENTEVQIKGSGSWCPRTEARTSFLTERQEEILQAAVQNGYYNIPRDINNHDLGKRFGIAPQTVGDHLRRIERKLIHNRMTKIP